MSVKVGIIMGSDSDLPVMSKAAEILDELQVPYELTIVSAHRTPDRLCEYAKTAEEKGLSVIIAGAGGAAHLPGMTAAMTVLPVIGVPVQTRLLAVWILFILSSRCHRAYRLLQWPSMVHRMQDFWQPRSWPQRMSNCVRD